MNGVKNPPEGGEVVGPTKGRSGRRLGAEAPSLALAVRGMLIPYTNKETTMSEVQTFAPSVQMPGGGVVTPPGWMWVLGFALGGCQWAIEEADKPEFKARIRADLEAQKQRRIDEQIADLETKLAALKAQKVH